MQKNVSELIFDLASDIEEVRKVAIIWLSQEGDAAAIPHLRRLTQDPSTPIRHFARRAIDTIEKRLRKIQAPVDPDLPPAFDAAHWEAQLASEDLAVRGAAARALQHYDEPAVLELARRRLAGETDPVTRSGLIAVVGRFHADEDLPGLLAATRDSNPLVRGEAVMALANYYDPSIIEQLLSMVRDPDNRTRGNVLLVLGRYDENLVQAPLHDMAHSPEVWMRDSCIYVLKNLRTIRSIELLGSMAQSNRQDDYLLPKIQRSLQDLASTGETAATRVLTALDTDGFEREHNQLDLERVLDNVELELRQGAAPRELRVRRTAVNSVEEFQRALNDPSYERRLSAVEAAVAIDRTAALDGFRERLVAETHPFVVSKLVKELGRVGEPADVDLIARGLTHPDGRVRANAVEGLSFIGGQKAYDLVRPLLDDPVSRVKANAARMVLRIDRERAFSTLKGMVVTDQAGVSDSAIYALGEVWTDDVLDLLELSLGKEDQEVKIKIFKVLQRLSVRSQAAAAIYAQFRKDGDRLLLKQGDVDAMLRILSDPDPAQRLEAVEGLRKSADVRARGGLERALSDADLRVQRAAQSALRVYELELERGTLLYQLGSLVYRAWRSGRLDPGPLLSEVQGIEAESHRVDQGGEVSVALARRNHQVVELGVKGREMLVGGSLEWLEEGLATLSERVLAVDKRIADRQHQLEEEWATGVPALSTTAPAAPAIAPRPPTRPPTRPQTGVRQAVVPKSDTRTARRVWVAAAVAVVAVILLAVLVSHMGTRPDRTSWTWPLHFPTHLYRCGPAVVAVDSRGHLTALEAASGKVLWETGGAPTETGFEPRADATRLYCFYPDGMVRVFRTKSGGPAWSFRGKPFTRPPAVLPDGLCLVSKAEARLLVLEKERGTTAASYKLEPDTIFAVPGAGKVFYAKDGAVGLLNTKPESRVWETAVAGEVLPNPFELAGNWIVHTPDHLYAFTAIGQKAWERAINVGARVLPPDDTHRELALVNGSILQLLEGNGHEVMSVTLAGEPRAVAFGPEGFYYAPTPTQVRWFQLKGRQDRPLMETHSPIADLLVAGSTLYVATAAAVEARGLAAGGGAH